jgi:hypothetical protein
MMNGEIINDDETIDVFNNKMLNYVKKITDEHGLFNIGDV